MPKRGSVQFLLLLLRSRALRRLGVGAFAVMILGAGLVQLKDDLPFLAKSGLSHALRQSVWQEALSGQSHPGRWPWEDLSVNMSLAPSSKVPRLGLSAAMLGEATAGAPVPVLVEPRRTADTKPVKADQALGDVVIGDVTIGDSITFTAADGATCIYRVTGRQVVDPHLAEDNAERTDGLASLFNCGPLDRLVIQATQDEPQPVPQPADDQRKL
jgi:hypothetical protein